ncbi:family 1 glycosylhydrolase [Luteipulveratus flavus]|uniref:Family 1 glycosylhydrolase n=1 Tax=Luteipulveratus flavus TaxID=3031728 RepID=A0ABT6C2E0_9MICO|nr:family 1 glycosylhydrolase [Luteipulveratus sp. YIM 133296]MDF8262955.1 family 1 glycosylhydrolase [Luteipulveratus sp. YIM 133296]
MADSFPPGSMSWLLGIEDTCVHPPARFDMATLDEHALTDHDTYWREDLDTVRRLGATGLRYGVSWPLVHVAPGVFDWSVLDERLPYAAGDLGLTVIADLVHYGTPTWLDDAFADPGYPAAIAEFAGAFAARYRGLVDHITPLNEPVTTASFSGLRGIWPPALTGWTGWTTVALGVVAGIRAAIAAARAANPDVVVVHVEASALYLPSTPDLESHAELLRSLATLPTDLLLGRVDGAHPMYGWLLEHGAGADVLAGLRSEVPTIDLLGMNYYPDLTPRTLVDGGGAIEQVTTNRWVEGLRECLQSFAARYQAPILVTETSIEGSAERRADWLTASTREVLALREAGLDIRGYTWWPLLDFVDWSYASGGRNVEEFLLAPTSDGHGHRPADEQFGDVSAGKAAFLRRMGLLSLHEGPDGTLARVEGAASAAFRSVADRADRRTPPEHVS